MRDDIREALNHAWGSLATATDDTRATIQQWIDQLLDMDRL